MKKSRKASKKAGSAELSDAASLDFLDFLNRRLGGPDSDGDGLTDRLEKILGTNPRLADSDGDGLSDFVEIRLGRNPLGGGRLRDFFTPHSGNHFQPQAVKGSRVFFYILSAGLIKTLLVLFALGLPLSAWLSPDWLAEQSSEIIRLTNQFRTDSGVAPLRENQQLQQAAYAKAQDMLSGQYFAHTNSLGWDLRHWLKASGYRYLAAGENLAIGFNQPQDILKAWQASPTHRANLLDADFSEIGVATINGAYQNQETNLTVQLFGYPVQPFAFIANKFSEISPIQPLSVAADSESAVTFAATNDLAQDKFDESSYVRILPTDGLVTATADLKVELQAEVDSVEVVLNGKSQGLMTLVDDTFSKVIRLDQGDNRVIFRLLDNGRWLTIDRHWRLDNLPPTPDLNRSKITAAEFGDGSWLLKAEVYWSEEPVWSTVTVGDYQFNLQPDPVVSGRWFGQLIGLPTEALRRSAITLASINAKDQAGNASLTDIQWQYLPISVNSELSKYQLNRWQSQGVAGAVFKIGDALFRLMAAVFLIVATTCLVLGWRRVRLRAMVSAFGLVALFLLLAII